jgi:hypothetical protein
MKASHNYANICFRLYEYHCDHPSKIEERGDYLLEAFSYYFLAWHAGIETSKKNIKLILDRLKNEPKFATKSPGLYLFFVVFFSSIQEKKFKKIVLEELANAFVGLNAKTRFVVQNMIQKCETSFESLTINDLNKFMAEFVHALSLSPQDLEEFLIPETMLTECNHVAEEIYTKTTDKDLVIFVGRSLAWPMDIFQKRFPERNILHIPFSLLERGYGIKITNPQDLQNLGIDAEIESYKNYLLSLGFGPDGNLHQKYDNIILADYVASGTSMNVFRFILQSLHPDLEHKMKAILCKISESNEAHFTFLLGLRPEFINLSSDFCLFRSVKYGPNSIQVPGFVFTPDLWCRWQSLGELQMPISPIVQTRFTQIDNWLKSKNLYKEAKKPCPVSAKEPEISVPEKQKILKKMADLDIMAAGSNIDELYKLGISFRKGEDLWHDLDRLDQLLYAKMCFDKCVSLGTKDGKIFHNLGNVFFYIYEYCCNNNIQEETRSNNLFEAFMFLYFGWSHHIKESKTNIHHMLNKLETDEKLKTSLPSLYIFMYSLFSMMKEENFNVLLKRSFVKAYLSGEGETGRIAREFEEKFKKESKSTSTRSLDVFMSEFVRSLNLPEENFNEFLLPPSILEENNLIAEHIQAKTNENDLVVFIGRSLCWAEEMFKKRFPERKTLNLPFSLISRGQNIPLNKVSDLKNLKMDAEIEAYKEYLDSLGFGPDGDLIQNYDHIVFVDLVFSGVSMNIFRLILEDLNSQLKNKMKSVFCRTPDKEISKTLLLNMNHEVIDVTQDFLLHRSYKHGANSILVPGFVFTPDLWHEWKNIENLKIPHSPIVTFRLKQIEEWLKTKN